MSFALYYMTISRRAVLVGAAGAFATKEAVEGRMTHVALLGDSVIDNKAYIGSGPDVAEQLRTLSPAHWKVTALALDGAVLSGVARQFSSLPPDVTHLVISAGGNDALGDSGILEASARSVSEVLGKLAQIQDRFRGSYAHMLDTVAERKLRTAICTIYEPRFPDLTHRRSAAVALSTLNDVITREAFARRLSLIDLRVIFNEDTDFANPIEPSVQGGNKLARSIHRFAAEQPQVII
jgi:hypothetical protein